MCVGSPGLHLPLLAAVGAAPLHVGQPGPRVRQEVEGGDLVVRLLRLEQETERKSESFPTFIPSAEPNLWIKLRIISNFVGKHRGN